MSGRPPRIPPTERLFADIHRLMQEREFESIEEANAFLQEALAGGRPPRHTARTPLERAQELMYRAWEAPTREARLDLAASAIAESRDCADAFVLLAEEGATSEEAALGFYTLGVLAGERSLGTKVFAEQAGHFWGLLETRPYMRARLGLAQTLSGLSQSDEAIGHYRELLRLNENDNQGVRYLLAAALTELNRDHELSTLLEDPRFAADASAAWEFTRALVAFRQAGATPEADRLLGTALRQNPHVPDYLTGRTALPKELPDTVGFGDLSEAVAYAADFGDAWRSTAGAVEWLGRIAGPAGGRKRGRGRRS